MRNSQTARALSAAALLACVAAEPAVAADARSDVQTTQMISRSTTGGVPDGASGHSVVSGDKRYARAIAFESDASDLVGGDTNGQKDVFATLRGGTFGNKGSPWEPGKTVLVSRTVSGAPADGPSWAPSIDGSFGNADIKGPSCVGFLSAATNLIAGDTNGKVDAFVAGLTDGAPKRVSPDVGADATAVAVSGDCSHVATVAGDHLYVYDGRTIQMVTTDGAAADPSYGVGRNQDLVYATPSGVWLLEDGKTTPRLVAPGGADPAYNDVKQQTVAYTKQVDGVSQVYFRFLGKAEKAASEHKGALGNGPSMKPLIGNSGFSILFQSGASNLGVNALGRIGDDNGQPDAYLYTDVRDLTLVQSVKEKAVPLPGGGQNPGMNFYNNYVTFDSPAPLGASSGPTQVFMRYLGGEASDATTIDELPPPTVGKTANVEVAAGTVYIKVPGGAKVARKYGLSPAAASGFVKLTDAQTVPLGSTMDTTKGRMLLQTAVGTSPGATQVGTFSAGVFQMNQVGGKKRPTTELTMNGALQCRAGKAVVGTAAKKKKTERHVWGSDSGGRFRTRGRNSSATVRGTYWLTKDTCTSTVTVVREGSVVVRDFGKHKNVTVKAGHRYTARAR
jgi:hypothetical protein